MRPGIGAAGCAAANAESLGAGVLENRRAEELAEAVRVAAAVGAGTVAVVSGGPGNHIAKHARRLLVELAEMGLPLATEALDPIAPHYRGDLVSWTAIGARTTA